MIVFPVPIGGEVTNLFEIGERQSLRAVDAGRRAAFGVWIFIVVASKRKVATMPGRRITDLQVSKYKEIVAP